MLASGMDHTIHSQVTLITLTMMLTTTKCEYALSPLAPNCLHIYPSIRWWVYIHSRWENGNNPRNASDTLRVLINGAQEGGNALYRIMSRGCTFTGYTSLVCVIGRLIEIMPTADIPKSRPISPAHLWN